MRKTAAILLSLIIILANAVSLRSVELLPAGPWEQALAAEFTVLGFLSASALPLRILNAIVSADTGFCGQREDRQPREPENRQERNTASDPLIGPSPVELKTADSGQRTAVIAAAAAACRAFFPDAAFPVQGTQGPPGFVYLSFLVFLVILSLSNLPGEMLPYRRTSSRSRCARTGIFFMPMQTKKLISLLTACCFLFSAVLAPAAQAALDMPGGSASLAALLDDVIIPPTVGRITQGRYYGAGKLVIAVQDLHCHPETQRNIGEILALLDRRYRLRTVYVEGGYGQVDTSRLGAIRDAALRREIVETLLDEGRLTGAEYYSITAGRSLLLKGIEDEVLHRENIARLGRILDRKRHFAAKLALLDKDLAGMEAKYFNEKNRRLTGVIAEYRGGKIDGRKYYAALNKFVNDINRHPGRYNPLAVVRMDDYPNLQAYMELLRTGESLRYPRISRELQGLLRLLREKLPYREFNALSERTGNFTRLDELYILLSRITDAYGALNARKSFPELSRFFDYLEKSRRVNPLAMVEEEWRLVDAVRVGFSEDISELEVSFLADFYGVFRNYLLNTLSEEEYAYFTRRFGDFKRLWEKYAAVDRLKGMEEDLRLLDDYYAANTARNGRFIANIAELGDAPAGAAPAKGEGFERLVAALGTQAPGDVIVLVTGGFHTQGLAKLFEERKISYCTITPSVTRDTALSSARYEALAKQQAQVLSQALALGLASQLSSPALCELAVRAARRRLVEAGFTRNTLLQAAEELKKATGTDVTVTLDGQKASFAVAGGRTITLAKDAEEIDISLPPSPAERPDAGKLLLEELLAAAGATARAAGSVPGWASLVPGSYAVLRNLFAFAAEHRLIFGDGLLYELENDPRFADTVDGIPRELVADLPEAVQKIVAEHARRETQLSAAAQRSQWLGALCAVDLLRDCLAAADAGLPAPGAPAAGDEENDPAVFMGLSNLKGVISQQYLFNPNLHPVNREILETIVERIEGIFSGTVEAAGPSLRKEYDELLAATVHAVHSQAWLSPTAEASPSRERGIVQGDKYPARYEREQLDPNRLEEFLVRFADEGNPEIDEDGRMALLYRNANSLLADLCAVFLGAYKPGEIAVSPRLPAGLQKTLYLALGRAEGSPAAGEPGVYFVMADETGRPDVLPKDLSGRTVVVYADRAFAIPPDLSRSGAHVFVIYSLENRLPGAGLPLAFVTNYTPITRGNAGVFNQLRRLRERGGNIDSYAAWYLALYYDRTDPGHLDTNGSPYYYDALGDDRVREQVQETGDRYDALLALLGTVPAGSELDREIIRRLEARIRAHAAVARPASPRGPPADIDACRSALAEYRTILKHVVYLQWLAALRSGRAAERHAALERKLAQQYNGLAAPLLDASGAGLPRSTLLASSGMGAVKTILAFVGRAGTGQPKLLVGNNVYYEADTLVSSDLSGQEVGVVRVRERDTEAVVSAVASGEYRALVLDPVSNAMTSPAEGSVTEDLPVADLQAILRRLAALKYDNPFYVVLDASLTGPSFRITDYLDRADLPDNFHIVVYSSLQKLYQDGRELTAGGVITLLSGNEQAHRRSFELLAETRSSLGMGPSLLSCLMLDALSLDNAQLAARTARILANAQSLAGSLEAAVRRYGAKDAVVHPALPSHPDHEVWARNGKTGLPFVILRLESSNDYFLFLDILAGKLAAEGIPLQERDSYGFSRLTSIFYHAYTDKMVLRISLPPFDGREMEALTRAFEEAYAELRGAGPALTLGSSYALGRKFFGLFGWKPQDAAGRRKQDRLTELILAPFLFVWDLPVHTVLLFTARKDGLSGERVTLFKNKRLALSQVWVGRAGAVVSWAAAAAAWFAVSHFLPGGIAGAAAACCASAVVHSLYNLRFGSGTAANAPLTLPGIPDAAERNRLKRVLELDGAAGDHLFVEDENGRTDRLEVFDVSQAGGADREKLIASLRRWLEHAGPKKAVFGATLQSTLRALEEGPRPDRPAIVTTVLAVSRDADNEIRDVEALGVYGRGSKGTQVLFFEAAPWNRERRRRYRGAGSQLLAWIFAHGGSRHLSFTTPFQDLQDLFKRYAAGEYPWQAGWQLRENVLDAFIKDQQQRAAEAKQREWQLLPPEARIPLFDESARRDIDAVVEAAQGAEILVGIPCYNEIENLPALVAQVQAGLAARGLRAAVVVIGERVKPETVRAALALDGGRGVRVAGFTKHPRFAGLEGKKWSERAFFTIARRLQPRVFISLDADLTIDPSWIEKLAAPVLDRDADFVTPDYVRRYTADDKSLTHHIVSPLFSALYGHAVTEPVGGEFAVRVRGSGLLTAYLDTTGIWTAPTPYEALYLAGAFTRSAKVEEVWLGAKVHKPMDKGNYADLASRVYARPLFEQLLRDWDHVIARRSDRTIRATRKDAPVITAATAEVLDIRYDEWMAAYRAGFEKHREFYRKDFPYLFDRLQACYAAADPGAYDMAAAPWEAVLLIFLKQYREADAKRKELLLEALAPVFLARVITFASQMRGAPYADMELALRRQTEELAALKPFLASGETDRDFFERVTGGGAGTPGRGGLRAAGRAGRSSGARHAVVCYRFAEDGAAENIMPPVMTADGQTFVAVILRAGVGGENTGMKVEVDGKMRPVRADVSGGRLTLRVEGVTGRNKDAVISGISATLSGTGTIGGSRRAVKRMKRLLGRVSDLSLKETDFAARPVRIDDGARGKVSYDSDGTLVVPADLFDAAADAPRAAALLGELVAVRNAESFAAAQNIFVYMDAELNIEHFKRELKAFNAAGGTQMIIPESVFVGMNENALREIARLALRAGVRIYVNAVSERFTGPGSGFSGYAKVSEGKVHDFALGELRGTLISGYKDVSGLRQAFYASGSGAKILKFSELQSMKDGEGRLLWAGAITVLRTNALSLFAPKTATREHVRAVAYGLDWEKIPQAGDLETLLAAARSGQLDDARLAGSAVGRYLDKLGGDAAEAEAGALRAAFLEAVAERVLVKEKLDPQRFGSGLADTALEQVLGRKLLQQKLAAAGAQEVRAEVIARFDALIAGGASAAAVAAELKAEVSALNNEPDDAGAVSTIIELIGRLGEPKVLPNDRVEIMPFDEQSVNAILSAA